MKAIRSRKGMLAMPQLKDLIVCVCSGRPPLRGCESGLLVLEAELAHLQLHYTSAPTAGLVKVNSNICQVTSCGRIATPVVYVIC
jgi:hypothetical protein